MTQPPPRPLPRGGLAAAARNVAPTAAIAGFALCAFALFYGSIFQALRAPRVLLLAFTAPGVIGAVLLLGWSIAVWRGTSLLRRGSCAIGELESMAEAGSTLGSRRMRIHFSYRPLPGGGPVAGSTIVLDVPGLRDARAGESVAVCFDPDKPSRSMALAALG